VILPTSVLSCEFLLKPKKQDNAGAWATSTKYACRLGSGRYGSWNCVSKFDVMYLFVPVPMTTNGWPQKKKTESVTRGWTYSYKVPGGAEAARKKVWRLESTLFYFMVHSLSNGTRGRWVHMWFW
jgi:hypothetical protein